MYFGPHDAEGRSLFGWYHPAVGKRPKARAVVLCPPLGDSGGLDSDGGRVRVRAWIDSVGDAVNELRALSGLSDVCLFGVRLGATLAATSAAERGDIQRLVQWNSCPTGKAYVREMKAFRLFAEQTGELAARPRAEGDASEESGGFLITEETIKDLKALDALKLTRRAAAIRHRTRRRPGQRRARARHRITGRGHDLGPAPGLRGDDGRPGQVRLPRARLQGAADLAGDAERSFSRRARAFAAVGINNLNEKVGASMGALAKRPNFTIETIDGPDHSFTPL